SAASPRSSQGSASRTDVLAGQAVVRGGLVDEALRRRERALGVAERGHVARELHQIGLDQELAEQRAMRSLEGAVAGRRGEKFLRRHLRRADPEAVLEIVPDDAGQRRVELLPLAELRQPT